jgi:hypothetical protein
VLLTNVEHFLSKEQKKVPIHRSFPCPTKGLFMIWCVLHPNICIDLFFRAIGLV